MSRKIVLENMYQSINHLLLAFIDKTKPLASTLCEHLLQRHKVRSGLCRKGAPPDVRLLTRLELLSSGPHWLGGIIITVAFAYLLMTLVRK